MLILLVLSGTISTNVNGEVTEISILPETIQPIFSMAYSFILFALFIFVIIKYNKAKFADTNNGEVKQGAVNGSSTEQSVVTPAVETPVMENNQSDIPSVLAAGFTSNNSQNSENNNGQF